MLSSRPAAPARLALVALAMVLGGSAACGGPAPSAPPGAATPAPPIASSVVAAIGEAGIGARLEALARATADSDAFRAVGSTGYAAAAALVASELGAAGWTVTEDAFSMAAFGDDGPSTVEVAGRTFASPEVLPLIYAPAGAAAGPLVAIGWDPAATGPGSLGCRAADYGELPPDAIVLVRSGPCLRRDEVLAAQAAGAAGFLAVVLGAPEGRTYRSTLIDPGGLAIPAAAVSWPAALVLADAATGGGAARLVTAARTWTAETRTILAELPGSEPGRVVMLGAHLDSVIDGPGMNDNGSGVAVLLEAARALSGTRPRATIRLAFWAGEELGLHGSTRYVLGLDDAGRDGLVVYLNADMVGSPNGFAAVYGDAGAPDGSAAVRELLVASLERLGAGAVPIDTGGDSDHRAFAQAGVPIGGVYSGSTERLSAEQAATFGGTAGEPADACYHLACDDASNVSLPLARLLGAALADIAVRLANNPELVAR